MELTIQWRENDINLMET